MAKGASKIIKSLPAFRIVLIYVAVGTIWILLSDKLLESMVSDPVTLSHFQTVKGWFFVFFTGVLLYILIRGYSREKLAASLSLMESEDRFQLVASATNDVVWDWNLISNALWWNPNFFILFGYPKGDPSLNISSWSDHLHPEDKDRVEEGIHRLIDSGGSTWSDEYRFARADGTYAHIYDRGFVIRSAAGVPQRMVGTMLDITDRKKAEALILESRTEIRKLAAYVESAREGERTRIAREIHDELGQAMTALKMDVSWLEKKLSPAHPHLAEKTEEMIQLIDATIQSIRRIASELRPGVLDNLGIQAAIEWQAQEFESHSHIRCIVSFSPENITLDDPRSTAIFRILQETLTNVGRHAGATEVRISLARESGALTLEVADNGRGISRTDLGTLASFGILGIRERVSHFGGTVTISGAEGKGTTARIVLPMENHEGNGKKNTDR